MNRAQQRRAQREIGHIIRRDGDNCSLCRAEFPHNSKTFGGVTRDGRTVLVGECCAEQVKWIVTVGMVAKGYYEALLQGETDFSKKMKEVSPEEIAKGINTLQNYVAEIDEQTASAAKRAGISPDGLIVRYADTPWKADDAVWFKANPDRTHRMRDPIAGELKAMSRGFNLEAPPPNYRAEILVRQVSPGERVRAPFFHNIEVTIPDDDAVIHAMFDIISDAPREGSGEVFYGDEIIERALKYAEMKSV